MCSVQTTNENMLYVIYIKRLFWQQGDKKHIIDYNLLS